MEILEQIKIIKELIEATTELNGTYQDGWEENIEDGERLLEHLGSQLKQEGINILSQLKQEGINTLKP
jgi:hypothetical protein